LIAIESFTFDKEKSDSLSLITTTQYVGEVHFNIYGRGISEGETAEITRKLAEKCFGS
jgi:hypothetical protein